MLHRLFYLLLVFACSFGVYAQNLTISSGGESGTSGTNWSISGNVLNVAASGSASIHTSVITDHLQSTGDLTINLPWQNSVGRNININNTIAYSGSSARTLTFQSANDIVFANAVGITSSTASLNVVLRSTMGLTLGAPDNGLVKMDGINIDTKGGHFWVGGGTSSTTWNGLTVGNSYAVTWTDDVPGISLVGSSIATNGGNISMYAQSNNTSDADGFNYGIDVRNSIISSGSGNIYINADLYGLYTNGFGLRIYGTTTTSITSTSGSIQLRGYGGDGTTNGNLMRLACAVFGSVSIKSTSGAISITGDAEFAATVNEKTGLYLGDGAVVASQTGNITLRGTNTLETSGQYCNSIRFEATDVANSIRIGFDGTNAYSGNISIEGNSIYQRTTHAGSGSIAVQTTGTLTMKPTGTAFTYMRAGDSGTLTFDNDWNFGTTLSGFTLGNSTNTTNLTFANVLTTAGPITMSGGLITLNSNLTTTTNTGHISLLAKTHITNSSATTITTQGGNVLFASNVDDATDGETTTNGYIQLRNGITVNSNGGNITFGGGNTSGSDYALGTSSEDYTEGIRFDAIIALNSGNGNIVLRGKSYARGVQWTWGASGVGFYYFSAATGTINSGTGTITIDGYSQTHTSTYAAGFYCMHNLTISSANTTANAISITGKAIGASGEAWGIESESTLSVLATGTGGGITINTSKQLTDNYDAVFRGETNILAVSGPINLKTGQLSGTSNGYLYLGGHMNLGSKAGSSVTSSSSNINIQFDRYEYINSAKYKLATSGSVTLQPNATSFTIGIYTSDFNLNQNSQTMSGFTFGKSGNTGNLYPNTEVTSTGPVNIYGATIGISGALTASGSDLSIYASTAVTQSQPIVSSGLSLNGTGTFTLTNTSNSFSTLAGGAVGSLIGATQVTDISGGLTIGTIGSNSGLKGSSTILVETLAGNLTLAGSISTNSTSTDAVILTAAKTTAIGVGTGGDIIVSGSPTITMGSGGIAKLFSGLESSSTGLTSLAGGSSNVRNNYDETTTTFSPVLSANNRYAIYRTSAGVGSLTIVSSSGDAINTTWTYDNGVINTITNPVNILSSVIENYLTSGPLTINAGNTTISAAITSTYSNALVLNGNSTLSNTSPTTNVNAAITNAGSITINTGTFNVAQNITTTSTAAITISATTQISTSTATRRTISTQGGNITLNADSDANGTGWLDIDDLTLNPGAANLIVRGETFNVNGTESRKPYINGTGSFTFESNDASFGQDIASSWFVIDQDANGISGFTFGKSGNAVNVYLNTALTVAGPISVYGNYVEFTGNITSSATGDIFIKSLYAYNPSVYIGAVTINKSAGTGTLTFQANGRVQNHGTLSATGTGRLNVVMWSDYDNTNNDGGVSQFGTISTNGGHVWVGGSNSTSGSYNWNGLTVGDGPSIGSTNYNCNAIDLFGPITTGEGDVLLWAYNAAPNCGANGIVSDGSRLINAGLGNITLIAPQTSGAIELTSTGVISLVPNAGSYASGLTLGGTLTSGNFTFNTSHYNGLKINSLSTSGLVIGNYSGHSSGGVVVTQGNTSTVTASTALSTKSLGIYGGTVIASAALTSAGNMVLDGDTGSFLTQNTKGVEISAALTTTNNGNITIHGRGGNATAMNTHGINVTNLVEAGGTGNIELVGYGGLSFNNTTGSSCHGVNIEGANAWVKSNGGNVSITGYGGGAGVGTYSQGVPILTNAKVSAGGSGTVTITGTGGVNTAIGLRGIVLTTGSSIYSSGGAISLTGNTGTNGSDNSDGVTIDASSVGSNTSGPITITGTAGGGTGSDAITLSGTNTVGATSHANTINLKGNNLSITGATSILTTGQVIIEPTATSFTSAIQYPITNLSLANTITGLTLGKTGNTADLTMSTATTINGPITLYGGTLNLNANLTTTSSNSTASNISLNGSTISGTPTLTLATGSTLTMNLSSNTNFAGPIVGTSLSFLKNGAGTLSLTGATALSFVGFTISGGTYRLNGNQQLTLSNALTNNGTFTMKDGATFLQGTSVTSITGTGTYNVEKALSDNSSTWSTTSGRFWYMGVPMVSVARSSYGTSGATTNRVWSYAESTKSYTELTDGNALLSAGTGYVHRRTTNDTLTFSAAGANGLYGGDLSLTNLTRTAGTSAGYHLVSNPYMAYLDWNSVTKTNIEPTFYIRTNNTTNSNISALISYNSGTNLSTNTSSVTATTEQLRYIAPLQSIWVRVGTAAATGSLGMTRGMLSHQTGNVGLKSSTVFPTLARVNLVDGNNFDQLLVYLNGDMSNEVDQYDSEKMAASGTVQVYTMSSNRKLVMNGLKNNKKKVSVPLYLELPETKSYTLQLSEYMVEDGLILLEDKQEGTIQDFTLMENYSFYANSGLLQNRFVLHFILPDPELTTQGPSNSWVASEGSYTEGGDVEIFNDDRGNIEITLNQPEDQKVEGTVFVTDMNGKAVYSGQLEGIITAIELDVPSGIYYLTVQSGTLIEKKKVFIQE